MTCPNSEYGTHRCIRCDSEVEDHEVTAYPDSDVVLSKDATAQICTILKTIEEAPDQKGEIMEDPYNPMRWSKEAEFLKGAKEYRAFNDRFSRFLEDLAERPTRYELEKDDHAIVPAYKTRSEEYDLAIIELRELLEEQQRLLND